MENKKQEADFYVDLDLARRKEDNQYLICQLFRIATKVNEMHYHVKSRSQIKLKPSEFEWEQLANKIDVIHDVIMNNRYNGGQRQQQQQQQYPPKSCVFCSSFDHRSSKCPSQQCYSCQEYGHFASECPWNGCPFDDDFPESCNPDEETPSEPTQAMDVEPSTTPAVPQTPPKNRAVLPPPPKRPKKPEGLVFKPTEKGWKEVSAPKVSAKKVKYGQAKLKRKLE